MLRRNFASTVTARNLFAASASSTPFLASTFRYGGQPAGPGRPLDHSASMSGKIDAATQATIDAQAKRTVAAFVPGKLFMRHWIAGIQAFESIYNRILSLIVTMGIILYGSVYSSNGTATGLNSAVFAMFALMMIFIPYHTHHLWHGGLMFGAFLVATEMSLLH